ncbi:MAG: branched-chain-amino-acid transaminase [Candidatus Bathyarchaeota archaeon]|nr:branched-chain-amino-acid transaminase [Candidatus Bathyarchaeota archaeon]
MSQEYMVYIDGKYVPKSEAKISVFDHGLLYGDGVFEGIRSYEGAVFRLDQHLTRLFESAKSIDLQIPLSYEEFKEAILETLRTNKLTDAYVRVVVTRGIGTLGLTPATCPKPTIIIIADHLKPLFEGVNVKAVVASTRRNAVTALNPMIKSLNYLNNILARIEAIKAKVDEAIMLNQNGTVAEGTGDNVFIVKDEVVITPPPTAGILLGVTRDAVITLAREERIQVLEKDFTVHEVYNADEAFLSGTAAEIVPLVEVDGKKIGNGNVGSITSKLIEKFKRIRRTGTPIYLK